MAFFSQCDFPEFHASRYVVVPCSVEGYSVLGLCRSLNKPSPGEGHLSSFRFGAIVNKAAVNIGVQVFV